MSVGTDAEILRLRAAMRDLVALSVIPSSWVGIEPSAVAAGLGDALIGLLQVEFAYVRLCEPGGTGAVEVVRGDAWPAFRDWLERELVETGGLGSKQIVPDIDGADGSCCGVVIPIGVNGEAGVLAAACGRSGFPAELDELVLSLAGTYGATAFQSAQLLHERRRIEAELRQARGELEAKVRERTAELQRSEGDLAEAQRLAHTGSFALGVRPGEPTHSSDENSRLHGFDPELGLPTPEQFLDRVHPDDRAVCAEALERGIRDGSSFDLEYRVEVPGEPLRYLRAVAHPILTESGEVKEFVGTVMDVTERKHAEEERQAQLWFFEAMDRVHRAIQGAEDLGRMMIDVLDVVLEIFRCDRAWLIYPCDPEAPYHRVTMERAGADYLGGSGVAIPTEAEIADIARCVLTSSAPVRFVPEPGRPPSSAGVDRFGFKSVIAMAVHPKVDKPYMFGLQQCSQARIWTAREERLFEAIGRRLADALDTLLMLRDLRVAHQAVQTSRDELRALVKEQTALRRVATLVAQAAPPEDVFAAVVEEVGHLLPVDLVGMGRYQPDRSQTIVASWGGAAELFPVGRRLSLGGNNLSTRVFETGRPARMDSYADATGRVGATARASGFRSAVGTPIIVEGRLWGVIIAGSSAPQPLPSDTEARLADFTKLLATAIANAESRAALAASRARVVAAADEARRRIERDLHDGAQQRLVSLGLELREVQAAVPPELGDLDRDLSRLAEGLASVGDELREISRGIHPAILSDGGLGPALRALARRSAVPVELRVSPERRLPERVEVAAYYVVSEALTNAAKHAHASSVRVSIEAGDYAVRLEIRDDGIGGADARRGSGLIGLTDRVEALGGWVEMSSPAGRGTSLLVRFPLEHGS